MMAGMDLDDIRYPAEALFVEYTYCVYLLWVMRGS